MRIKFQTAEDVLTAFPTLGDDLAARPDATEPLRYTRRLAEGMLALLLAASFSGGPRDADIRPAGHLGELFEAVARERRRLEHVGQARACQRIAGFRDADGALARAPSRFEGTTP